MIEEEVAADTAWLYWSGGAGQQLQLELRMLSSRVLSTSAPTQASN